MERRFEPDLRRLREVQEEVLRQPFRLAALRRRSERAFGNPTSLVLTQIVVQRVGEGADPGIARPPHALLALAEVDP